LLSSTLLRLQEQFENKTQIAEKYTAIKDDIYEELMNEFEDDLEKWKAVIDREELTIRFLEPTILFDTDQALIKDDFKVILKSFFPRYIDVLSKPEFKENIEEIRIEGHTDNEASYFHNMELSQARTRSVLKYVLNSTDFSSEHTEWIISNITANGLSFSKPLVANDTEENRTLNRRVEFRIRTNAEKQIDEILNLNLNE
jgi:outer membrane protein OmpA-like peptidoglycan-associated protein